MKKLLIYLLFLIGSNSVFAQINQRVKSIYFENADSTTVRTNAANCADCGFLYYNKQGTNHKFRVFQDSVWYDLLTTGSGGTTFVNNTPTDQLMKSLDSTESVASEIVVTNPGSSVLVQLGSNTLGGSTRHIFSGGSSSDYDLNLSPKGIGNVVISGDSLELGSTGSTGSSRSINVVGSVADISLNLRSKGTGIISLGNKTGIGLTNPTAFFEVKGTGTGTNPLVILKNSIDNEKFKILENGNFEGTATSSILWYIGSGNYLQASTSKWSITTTNTGTTIPAFESNKYETSTTGSANSGTFFRGTTGTATNGIENRIELQVENDNEQGGILEIGHELIDVTNTSMNSSFHIKGLINSTGARSDFLEIRSVTSGDLWHILKNVPTVNPCASAPSGTLWNNANVINICP